MTAVVTGYRQHMYAVCLTALMGPFLSAVAADPAAATESGSDCKAYLSAQDMSAQDRATCLETQALTNAGAAVMQLAMKEDALQNGRGDKNLSVAKMILPDRIILTDVKPAARKEAEVPDRKQKEASVGVFSPISLLLFGAAFVGILYLGRRRRNMREEDS
ncbi:hypothetical protein [Sneathiella sp.]|uniref:hypothetical protein n=1 Tax=Sneathiella sp. TaxID=1964365 RepID=UPI0025D0DF0D|nr:hypothetical protein [Sneathiella sp.]